MEVEIDKRYCQSCGMPLDINQEELFGSNQDGTKNHAYCFYCFQNGKYTVDYPMGKTIEIWVENTNLFNKHTGCRYTPEELRTTLCKRLPTLKRWKQKDTTKNTHYEIIGKIQAYINRHLFDEIDIIVLSRNAGLSKYHFFRTFKAVTGENTGTYIQRLRFEHIAHLLLTTDLSLSKITNRINYQNKNSLSKAFKKFFGISPSDYKKKYKQYTNEPANCLSALKPRMKTITDLSVLHRSIDGSCATNERYKEIWRELISYQQALGFKEFNSIMLSISMDDPLIIPYSCCRFYIGFSVPKEIKPKGKSGVMRIPDSLYAIFQNIGDYSSLQKLYRDIYLGWLPQSEYRQRDTLSFEVYTITPIDGNRTDLITDIYIPVEKLKNKDNE